MKKLFLFFIAVVMLTFISCGDDSSTSSDTVDRIMRAKIRIGLSGTEEYLSNENWIKLKINPYHEVGAFPVTGDDDPINKKYWYLQFNPQLDDDFNLINDTLRFSEDTSSEITLEYPEGVGSDTTYFADYNSLHGTDRDLTIVFKSYSQGDDLIEAEFSGWIKNTQSNVWYKVESGYFRTNSFIYGK